MISKNLVINSIEELINWVASKEIKIQLDSAASILVQVFSSNCDPEWMLAIESNLRPMMPQAVIAGTTTMGEIAKGKLFIHTTVVAITFFDKARIQGFLRHKDKKEVDLGIAFAQKIETDCQQIAGTMLYATPNTMNVSLFLEGFSTARKGTYPVFGGGAGDYHVVQKPVIMLNGEYTSTGVLAVVFMSDDIQIDVRTYLGWQALSKEMVITESDGLWIKKIDDQPAFDVLNRYLDIQNDDEFFYNVLVFPFLFKRDGINYAMTPIEVNDEKAIKVIMNINEGESVCIGYGNPAIIIEKANDIQNWVRAFNSEAIFLYSCICRRFLLQGEVDLETIPFETIAPTAGFYTYGEIVSQGSQVMFLNATMLAVSMKEGCGKKPKLEAQIEISKTDPRDPFTSQHTRIITRLVNFIKVVTQELEEANEEARRLAEQDYLTKTNNRMKAHEFIKNEIERSKRYELEFSIIMLDMDFFKKVNDTYGHNIGDEILIYLVKLLKLEIRKIDMLSRWGGEEFLIVMPLTDKEGARITAERIRAVVELSLFPNAIKQTCSFGVASYQKGESIEMLIDRADKALYEAKLKGRNCVVTK
ncbi:sensor domain-containing diguanylate cyclase [Acetobacterium woodii]|uniref:GGDEF domain-containing protein n=1 Tax=Acetobacterium woodii (strain ATCC 29683 / DSM 1030 / JCM 2381 / KCTC 1655 / WB1) TaxID=931626 RepID=H6LH72_ACEWD|nr:diguanylate cyclase [Acetobacterium woodii]AFA48410.1 hypothetical protein containing diguanylate cyclase domain [Acetobacterium woodii DSM 1030]